MRKKGEEAMKKIISCVLSAAFILCASGTAKAGEKQLKGKVTLSGAWALYPMAVKWAEEFQKIHPQVKIDVAAGGAGKGMADALSGIVDIGMVSREIYPEEIKKGAWEISVVKDAVVPTVNENNPVLSELLSQGVKRETFVGIWVSGTVKSWGEVVASKINKPINVYTRSDACGAAQTWAEYLGKKQEDLLGVGVYGDPGLAEAVRKDILGIGFNNINYAYDNKTKRQVKGIRVVPIDINADGKIDQDEKFYSSEDKIIDAIARGKYPSPPARNLHFVTNGKPANDLVKEFVRWILTDGQKYVLEAGYINLPKEKLSAELKKINE
jgi:phosphate transport system substrate-binding protein